MPRVARRKSIQFYDSTSPTPKGKSGREVREAVGSICDPMAWMLPVELHDSTSPEAVAADQRNAILEIYERGMPIDRVVELVCLPPDVVVRRLNEITTLRRNRRARLRTG